MELDRWNDLDADCMHYSTLCIRVEAIAKKRGVSMAQVSLAWIIARPGESLHNYFVSLG